LASAVSLRKLFDTGETAQIERQGVGTDLRGSLLGATQISASDGYCSASFDERFCGFNADA